MYKTSGNYIVVMLGGPCSYLPLLHCNLWSYASVTAAWATRSPWSTPIAISTLSIRVSSVHRCLWDSYSLALVASAMAHNIIRHIRLPKRRDLDHHQYYNSNFNGKNHFISNIFNHNGPNRSLSPSQRNCNPC